MLKGNSPGALSLNKKELGQRVEDIFKDMPYSIRSHMDFLSVMMGNMTGSTKLLDIMEW
jgi:hypothetical protein